MGFPFDILGVSGSGDPRSHPDAAVTVPGTELLAFDLLAIENAANFDEVVGNVARYGPYTVLEVPNGNTQAVITAVAVQFEPDSLMYRWGWFFQISRGAVQELDMRTSVAAGYDAGRSYAGRIWSPFAALDSPDILRIRVDPGAKLQIVATVGLPVVQQPVNFYVRLIGYYQEAKR